MLDADEHGLAVGAPGDPGDLALAWADEEAANLARSGVAHQHHVVALAGEVALVGVLAVGLDPEAALAVEGDAIRRVEHVVGIHVGGAGARVAVDRRIAGDDVEVPCERGGCMVAAVGHPAHDLAVLVLLPRVGSAHRRQVAARIGLDAAVLVVGEAAVGLGLVRVGRHPFGPVHGRGAHRRGSLAGVNADLSLGRHAGGLRRERDPLACAIVREPGDGERAALQQVAIVAALGIDAVAHELVKELAPLVVAQIDHDPAVGGERHLRVLVLEAAESGALLGHGRGIQRIDLHHVARAVGLVGMLGNIEPLVRHRPAVAAVLRLDAVTLVACGQREVGIARREVAVEILLAGQIGAPGRAPVAAVVPGAERGRAGGVGGGLHEVVPARGPGDLHRRVGGDTAVVRRILDDPPGAVLLRDLDDGDAVARLALAHVVGGLGFPRLAVGEHDVEVHVLVVHGEDVLVAVGEQRHAVVVVAVGGLLAFAGAATRMVEGGACRPERIAPAGHHMPAVAVGYGNRVEAVGGDGREIEACGPRACRVCRHAAGTQHKRGRAAGRGAAKESAPRDRPRGQPLEIGG